MTTSLAILPWYLDHEYMTEGEEVEERISADVASQERVATAFSGTMISFTDSSELVSGTKMKSQVIQSFELK